MSMTIGERILSLLSRPPNVPEPVLGGTQWTVDNALDSLKENFPGFEKMCRDRYVLDFGCAYGFQSVPMARAGAARVLGIDINGAALARARQLAGEYRVSDRVSFLSRLDESVERSFDFVVSQNSMEHFSDPLGVFRGDEVCAAARRTHCHTIFRALVFALGKPHALFHSSALGQLALF